MDCISEEEKNNLLQNATISFVHGIEHFVDYKNDEKNIKFSIIHIFNAVELILKAYLGVINEALLWDKIDNRSDKSATIAILLGRMKQFSKVNLEEKFKNSIEDLRKKRNEIEHKKFVLENEREAVKLLNNVIYGLLVFCKKNIGTSLNKELTEEIENKLDNIRSEFDLKIKNSFDRVKELKEKGYKIKECPDCLNKTVAFRKAKSKIKCFYCGAEFVVIGCNRCSELQVEKENDGGNIFFGTTCNKCYEDICEEDENSPEFTKMMKTQDIKNDIEYNEIIKEYFVEDYK